MKVYVVWWNNGEEWEDNWQFIDKIFLTREAAEKYLGDIGFIKEEHKAWKTYDWENHKVLDTYIRDKKEYVCKEGYTECDNCQKYLEWIDNDYEPEDFCDEYDNMPDGYPDYTSYEIQEWEVLE